MANRDTRHTEFGGGPGGPGRFADGSSKTLTPGERARVERMKAMRDVPSFTEPREQVYQDPEDGSIKVRAFPADVAAINELREKTNRYSDEEMGSEPQ